MVLKNMHEINESGSLQKITTLNYFFGILIEYVFESNSGITYLMHFRSLLVQVLDIQSPLK